MCAISVPKPTCPGCPFATRIYPAGPALQWPPVRPENFVGECCAQAAVPVPERMMPKKACPGRDPGWVPVSRLREALVRFVIWLGASAGEGRSEKIVLLQQGRAGRRCEGNAASL
jgi:hypothetical protein